MVALVLALAAPGTVVSRDAAATAEAAEGAVGCPLPGLTVRPPSGWLSLALENNDAAFNGCQLMRLEDDDVAGILRVLSMHLTAARQHEWHKVMIGLEAAVLTELGYELGKGLWQRDRLEVRGEGLDDARVVALSAIKPGSENAFEVQFVTFRGRGHGYIVTLLTPVQQVDDGKPYERNTRAMNELLKSLVSPQEN